MFTIKRTDEFNAWLLGLKYSLTHRRLLARLHKASVGNLGDAALLAAALGDEVAAIFTQVLLICDRHGLIGRQMFAIDGVKLPSNGEHAVESVLHGSQHREAGASWIREIGERARNHTRFQQPATADKHSHDEYSDAAQTRSAALAPKTGFLQPR